MTFDDVLMIAITHEVRSQGLYRHLRNIVTIPEVQAYLQRLEEEERDHERRLYAFRGSADYNGASEVGLPHVGDEVLHSHAVYVTLDKGATREDVLKLAMQREERAVMLFQRLSALSTDARTRAFFDELAEEEVGHQETVQKLFGDAGDQPV